MVVGNSFSCVMTATKLTVFVGGDFSKGQKKFWTLQSLLIKLKTNYRQPGNNQ